MRLWHRIRYGHWFLPHIIDYDKYNFEQYDGCGLCYLTDTSDFYHTAHANGVCPKQRLGYHRECRDTDREHGMTTDGRWPE